MKYLRKLTPIFIILLILPSIVACSQIQVDQEETSSEVNVLNLDQVQATKILSDTASTLDKSYSDKTVLSTRFNGEALDEANLFLKENPKKSDKQLFNPVISKFIPSSITSFPRVFFVLTEINKTNGSQNFLGFIQTTAFSNYKLYSISRLIPNTDFPEFPATDVGSNVLAPTSTAVLHTPESVYIEYSDFLAKQDKSQYKTLFKKDDLYSQTVSMENTIATELQKLKGDQILKYSLVKDSIFGLETYNKGGVFFGTVKLDWTRQTKSPKKLLLPVTDEEKALFEGKSNQTIYATYNIELVFYIPPVDSTDQIKILSAEFLPTKITSKK
jgi:hypothetical protein